MLKNLETRLEKLEAAYAPEAEQAERHVILMEHNESQADAMKRYEAETGRKVNPEDGGLVMVRFVRFVESANSQESQPAAARGPEALPQRIADRPADKPKGNRILGGGGQSWEILK
jgi:hypothetical protein